MSKKELNQISSINREIRMYRQELERLENISYANGKVLTGMPSGSGISDNVGRIATEIAQYRMLIEGKLKEIQLARKKIMEYIDTIEDSVMRQIIFLRCVSGLSWNGVADEVGGGNTEDSVRMKYNRFFQKR